MKPNQNLKSDRFRSILSVATFVILVMGVGMEIGRAHV